MDIDFDDVEQILHSKNKLLKLIAFYRIVKNVRKIYTYFKTRKKQKK